MSNEDYVPQHSVNTNNDDAVVGTLNPMLSNAMYDRLKFLAQVILPGVGALYFTLAQLWGLPAGEQVVGTIVAIDAFLGVFLGVSSSSYKDETEGKLIGVLDVHDTAEGTKMELNFPGDPMNIVKHKKVTFKIRKN